MNEKTLLHHVALQYSDRKQAEIFFKKILEIPLKKTFTLSKELTESIFGIKEEVIVDVYANDTSYFEIFITEKRTKYNYEHISIEINYKEEFIKQCKKYNIEPIFVKKGEKTLLFIKDYAGNLFEIKER
jgi:hypothetical protein